MVSNKLHSNQGTALDRWLDQRHAIPAERSTEQVLAAAAKLGASDPTRPYATSQALESQRGERRINGRHAATLGVST